MSANTYSDLPGKPTLLLVQNGRATLLLRLDAANPQPTIQLIDTIHLAGCEAPAICTTVIGHPDLSATGVAVDAAGVKQPLTNSIYITYNLDPNTSNPAALPPHLMETRYRW